jgi:hypothetical protein
MPRRLATAVFVLVLGVGVVSCSGGGDDERSAPSTTAAGATEIKIPLGDVTADSAGAPATVAPEQSQRIIDALTTYVKGATVQPLRSGKPATADFHGVFDAATLASATTNDRGIVLDEGLPKVTGDLTVTAQPVTIVGLADQAGDLTLATARFTLDVTGNTAGQGGPLHIVRHGDFVLEPDPTGVWKITAYNLAVARDGAGLSPTTSTTGATK